MSLKVAAWTEEGTTYPGYINVAEIDEDNYRVTVRERGHNGTKTSVLEIPKTTFEEMVAALKRARQ